MPFMEGNDCGGRRGRPPNVARRGTIVRAALELFADLGFEGTPMRAVAERAGISEALLYRYHGSKRELLDAVIAHVTAEADALQEQYRRAAQASSSLREFLLEIGTAFFEHLARMHPWYALRLQALPLDPEQRRAVVEAPERGFQTAARALAARGTFSDPYVTARAFFGAIHYQQMLLLRMDLEPQTPSLRRIFLDGLIDSIAASPPRSR